MKMRARSGLFAAAVALLVPAMAAATVVLQLSFEEMTRRAPVVVRGTVRQVQTRWSDQGAHIETWAELEVTERLKGAVGPTVVVRTPGGTIGELTMHVSGAAKFVEGQDTLVFLEPAADARNLFVVPAMAASKVDFEKSPKVGELRAFRHLDGLAFAAPAPAAVRPLPAVEDLGTPAEFLARIRRAAGGAK